MSGMNLGVTAQHVFPYSMSEMLEALRQTLDFSASYDLVQECSDESLFLFRVPQSEGILRASIVPIDGNRSRVDIYVPTNITDSQNLCTHIYKDVLEQAKAMDDFCVKGPVYHRLRYLIQRSVEYFRFKDKRPLNDFVYAALISNGVALALGVGVIFDEESEDKLSIALFLIAVMWCVSIASFVVTGPNAEKSGRKYAVLSIVFSIIVTIILVCCIRYELMY